MANATRQLRTLHVNGGRVERSLVPCQGRPLVVFHKSHSILKPRFSGRCNWQAFLDGSHGSKVVEASDPSWSWNQVPSSSFNCHTLSIGSYFGLGPGDWLEGTTSVFTLMDNPTQRLLDAFFDRVLVSENVRLRLSKSAQENDVVVFEDSSTNELCHSGRVKWVNDRPYILSKLGEHPIIISTLAVLQNEYFGQYDRICLYRLKEKTANT